MQDILKRYSKLLKEVDEWFGRCISAYPDRVACGKGCSECCRGLFDITLLDAWYLKSGFDLLPERLRNDIAAKAHARVELLQIKWPEFQTPYILNIRPEDEWEELMPDEDETPCPLLDADGSCLAYEFRPMTCRLHGLPMIDKSGEPFHDEWCTHNFPDVDPFEFRLLYWKFKEHFKDELLLFRSFTTELFQRSINEIDTFIPAALIMEYDSFDWKRWAGQNHLANALH